MFCLASNICGAHIQFAMYSAFFCELHTLLQEWEILLSRIRVHLNASDPYFWIANGTLALVFFATLIRFYFILFYLFCFAFWSSFLSGDL